MGRQGPPAEVLLEEVLVESGPRREKEKQTQALTAATETPRGETMPAPEPAHVAAAVPRGETLATADGAGLCDLVDRHLAEQDDGAFGLAAPGRTVTVPREPLLRGLPRSTDVHTPLDPGMFGYTWKLAGWTVKPDVLLVLGEGHPVGWVERGLDEGDGWVAVYEGYFLGDPATQEAAQHATPVQAAHGVHRAHIEDL